MAGAKLPVLLLLSVAKPLRATQLDVERHGTLEGLPEFVGTLT